MSTLEKQDNVTDTSPNLEDGQILALRLSDILLEHSLILKCEHCKKILKQALEIMTTTTNKETKKD